MKNPKTQKQQMFYFFHLNISMSSFRSSLLSLDEGKKLIQLARAAIETYLREGRQIEVPKDIPSSLMEKRGVFVSIHSYPDYELRGCIGLPYPTMELGKAVIDAAIAAAFEDWRFQSIEEKELDRIVIELSILTEPVKISAKDPHDYLKAIVVGKHGLIIKAGSYSGLLLPQVPVEQGWNEEEYLSGLCAKAGLPSDYWQSQIGGYELYMFEAQIFTEEKPGGDINEKKLKTY